MSGWISVDERLPERGKPVLATWIEDGEWKMRVVEVDGHGIWVFSCDCSECWPFCWLPLPSPPTDE
jgi:hypothetical protein